MGFAGDWAGTLNGLAFGGSSAYDLQALVGWNDMAEAPMGGAVSLAPKQTRNGSWFQPFYMPSRVVTMAFNINAVSGAFESAIDALRAATQPGGSAEIPLVLQLGGVSTTVNGTVTARTIPTSLDYLSGYTLAQIEVTCTDPRRFGSPLSATVGLPSSAGGLTWSPLTWPLVWASTQVTGNTVMVNPGNTSGPVTLRINGPVTGPTITHTESGLTLAMAPGFVVNTGDWLAIDCEARTVLYNGQSSRNGSLVTRGWPALLPGNNTFNFNAAAYSSTAQLVVTGTPSWI
jgi:hypothetical protein